MFGFSLQKLLVLAAIVAAVWYGFKWVSRLQKQRDAEAKVPPRKRRWPGGFGRAGKEPEQTAAEVRQNAIGRFGTAGASRRFPIPTVSAVPARRPASPS